VQRQLGGWLRSSHSLKECVIAHQSSVMAPRMVGIKPPAEAWPSDVVRGVGERSGCVEVGVETNPWSDRK
jgi:hypothetical protein